MGCNCNDCDTLGVAQGPAGRDGVSVVANNVVVVSTPADTLVHTLQTISIPGATLKTNGSKLVVNGTFSVNNAANGKFVTLNTGLGISILLSATGLVPQHGLIEIEAEIIRVNQSQATIISKARWYNFTVPLGTGPGGSMISQNPLVPFNFNNSFTVSTEGQNLVASANDVQSVRLDAVLYIK